MCKELAEEGGEARGEATSRDVMFVSVCVCRNLLKKEAKREAKQRHVTSCLSLSVCVQEPTEEGGEARGEAASCDVMFVFVSLCAGTD